MGYSIVIILIAMSALLAILGHDWVAGGMMTAAIALAVVFVLHQNPKSENVAEQEKDNWFSLQDNDITLEGVSK